MVFSQYVVARYGSESLMFQAQAASNLTYVAYSKAFRPYCKLIEGVVQACGADSLSQVTSTQGM